MLEKKRGSFDLETKINLVNQFDLILKGKKEELWNRLERLEKENPNISISRNEMDDFGAVISKKNDTQEACAIAILEFMEDSLSKLKENEHLNSDTELNKELDNLSKRIKSLKAFLKTIFKLGNHESINDVAKDFSQFMKKIDVPAMSTQDILDQDLSKLSIQKLISLQKEVNKRTKLIGGKTLDGSRNLVGDKKIQKDRRKDFVELGSFKEESKLSLKLADKLSELNSEIQKRDQNARETIQAKREELEAKINPLEEDLHDYIRSKNYDILKNAEKEDITWKLIQLKNDPHVLDSDKKLYISALEVKQAISSGSEETLKALDHQLDQELESLDRKLKDLKKPGQLENQLNSKRIKEIEKTTTESTQAEFENKTDVEGVEKQGKFI